MSRAKQGPGRPRLSRAKAHGAIFSVRLTPAERRAVERSAKRAGQKASAWARDVLLAAVGTRGSDPVSAPSGTQQASQEDT